MTPGGRVVVVVVVPEEGLGVVLPLLLAATTHRNPLADFLHSYLTVFTVRIVPTLTHFVSRISGLMFMITCAVSGFVETDSSITAKGDIDVNNEDPTIAPIHSTHMLEHHILTWFLQSFPNLVKIKLHTFSGTIEGVSV